MEKKFRVQLNLNLYYVQELHGETWRNCRDWRKKTLHFVNESDAIKKMEELINGK